MGSLFTARFTEEARLLVTGKGKRSESDLVQSAEIFNPPQPAPAGSLPPMVK